MAEFLTTKHKIMFGVLAIVISFAFGRYSASKPNEKIVADTKTSDNKKLDKDVHVKTVVTEVKQPNGADSITTVTTQDTVTAITDNKNSDTKESVVTKAAPKVNVSLSAGVIAGQLKGIYGLSVSKEFIGPITIGAFGFTDGLVGVSIGLNF